MYTQSVSQSWGMNCQEMSTRHQRPSYFVVWRTMSMERVVADGEGASKFVTINVLNSKTEQDAKKLVFLLLTLH